MPVLVVENKDDAFYSAVGPYLANRGVAKEIGYHIYEDEKTKWILSHDSRGLVAFALFRVCGLSATVTACYTVPGQRRKGHMQRVIKAGCRHFSGTRIRATANANSLKLFLGLGFKKVRANGRFHVVELANA